VLLGCDQGTQKSVPGGVLGPILPVNLVAANVGQNMPLPANGRIELAFDRLLLPASVTRQTFVLENAGGTIGFTPHVSYDPVARIVTITPLTDASETLKPNESYRVRITTPHDASDPNGLRAIDGATLASTKPVIVFFSVTDPLPTPPAVPRIDYCRDIDVIFGSKCSLGICHAQPPSAAGLLLIPPSGVTSTAIGRVAQGANTGPRAVAEPPSHLFGEDMPIVDQASDPSNSWIMYKVLLATPSPEPVTTLDAGASEAGALDGGPGDASAGDGGASEGGAEGGVGQKPIAAPIDVSHAHALGLEALSAVERDTLSNYVLGREMPFQAPNPAGGFSPLTLQEMERMSLWIAQGSPVPAACQP
jgi:hypothetical protein